MHVIELERSLRQLHLSGMASVLETRLRQAQAETMAPIDLIACLVSDELTLRADRLLQRRRKQAGFRDPDKTLDNFDFSFNPKMNRSLVFDLATGAFIAKREDAFFSAQAGPGRVTWPKLSGKPRFCRVTRCCIAKFTSSWMNWPTPSPMGRAKITCNRSPLFPCLSSTTSGCASCRTPPPRIYWRS